MSLRHLLPITLLVIGLITAFLRVQPGLNGAWQFVEPSGTTIMLTIADAYLMETAYEPDRFHSSRGGKYQQTDKGFTVLVEFDTKDSNRVGQLETYQVTWRDGRLVVTSPSGSQTYDRVNEPSTSSPLTGLWRITGRANEAGQLTTMQRGARKTLKLLTGSRFQWVAINPETKQFSGTGGGTYALKEGKYTETIDFFSRDNSRVGRSLTFEASVSPNEWRHSGRSSTGGRVDEVWSREK
ncbi:membrane or secreted protein [Spirosoma utsteinense]|uniref:Membrane or secreted protein n=1 Tax=Spirosoma utsteinense TaxID=2585773 RepID=A0ABR6W9P4_9BACT|nr:membrane or secreted protein [Spirosoma utsteinense]MBC3786766.1 hypothetical protein [Spirosoma utsteinense]MBC3793291.1 hypothetical protein [Spirosoma utsteinense]